VLRVCQSALRPGRLHDVRPFPFASHEAPSRASMVVRVALRPLRLQCRGLRRRSPASLYGSPSQVEKRSRRSTKRPARRVVVVELVAALELEPGDHGTSGRDVRAHARPGRNATPAAEQRTLPPGAPRRRAVEVECCQIRFDHERPGPRRRASAIIEASTSTRPRRCRGGLTRWPRARCRSRRRVLTRGAASGPGRLRRARRALWASASNRPDRPSRRMWSRRKGSAAGNFPAAAGHKGW